MRTRRAEFWAGVVATAAILSGCGAEDGPAILGGLAGAAAIENGGAGGSYAGGSGGVATGGSGGGHTGGTAAAATGGSGGLLSGGSGGLLSGGTGGALTGGTAGAFTGGTGGTLTGGTGGEVTGGTGGELTGGTGGELTGGTGGELTGGTGGELTGGTGGTETGGSGGSGGSGGDEAYPCDGDTSGYNAIVYDSGGGNWVAENGGSTVYSGNDMRAAMQAGIDSLTPGRSSKQSVLVQGSGTIAASARVSVASHTVLNVCGTINVSGSGSGDMAPVYAREVYGMFFRSVSNLRLGQIDMRLSSGLGIRIDSHGNGPSNNIQIDYVYVEGTSNHGVETYGVDNLTVGTVVARNTGYCGLILNETTNAEVGLVDADGAGTGTGYAAFRMANRNGRVGNSYPTNIHVGEVIARGGGRGIFCVSESGGAVIDRIDISDTGNNSILLENCYNVNIAAIEGSVTRGGDIRIAARSDFPNSSDITIQNLTVTDSAINENPCGDGNMVFQNNTLINSSQNVCN
jgi:hypothetical protein